jgi:hypothetical protein
MDIKVLGPGCARCKETEKWWNDHQLLWTEDGCSHLD